MNNNSEETINRDKLLLKLMLHAYDEDNNRNELIDTKNSQMIIFTGAILTLQATLLSNILAGYIILSNNIIIIFKLLCCIMLIVSFLLYLISIYYFMEAYLFSDDFQTSPTPDSLVDYAKEDLSLFNVQATVLATIGDTIKDNRKVIEDKLAKGEKGFEWLKRAGLTTFFVILLFLIVIF